MLNNSFKEYDMIKNVEIYGLNESIKASKYPMAVDTEKCNDEITGTTRKLGNSPLGSGHSNFEKGIVVQFDLTMTPKMSVELERYHFIDFVSSQSTMHKITKFDLDKSYIEYVDKRCIDVIKELITEYNNYPDGSEKYDADYIKNLYLRILYSNPCGVLLTARMTTNYQQLRTIYYQRRDHRLPEWQEFCDWIETLPHFKELCLDKSFEK